MKITLDNVMAHELIGLHVCVKECRDPTLSASRGILVDETKNTVRLRGDGKVKTVAKAVAHFVFTLPNGMEVNIEGSRLICRPEERVSRLRWYR